MEYKGDVTKTSCDTVLYTAIFTSHGETHLRTKRRCSPRSVYWRSPARAMLDTKAISAILTRREVTPHEKIHSITCRRLLYADIFSISASALEYSFDAPDAGCLDGLPRTIPSMSPRTSLPTRTAARTRRISPPAFGSPTSYTLNAGERLTPNRERFDHGSGQRHRRRDDTAFEWSRNRELELSAHRLHRRDK